jgi:dTDP-4-amino-4,6-dideoxygalactose transaminase
MSRTEQGVASDTEPIRSPERFLVFGSPLIGDGEKREVLDSLESGWIGTGPKVAEFERAFAEYKRASYATAVHSCTAALHLSMITAGLRPDDEVITTALTFGATVNAIIHAGARPVIADVDPTTFNIDIDDVESRITGRTRAILPVHFGGRPCDMDALCDLTERHGLLLIEDCAHAVETQYKGRHVGTFGDFGCFSFYVTKNLATGEGGMVLTPDERSAGRIRTLALHGLTADAWNRFGDQGYKHYKVTECGFKYNMMDIQAAIGIHQLRRIEENWVRRRQIWERYDHAFAPLPVTTPAPPGPDTRHAYHLYTVLVDPRRTGLTRDEFLVGMTAENIGVGVHYESIPSHPYYHETYGWEPEEYPNSHRIGTQTVSLPFSAKLTDEDVEDVIRGVRKVLRV